MTNVVIQKQVEHDVSLTYLLGEGINVEMRSLATVGLDTRRVGRRRIETSGVVRLAFTSLCLRYLPSLRPSQSYCVWTLYVPCHMLGR